MVSTEARLPKLAGRTARRGHHVVVAGPGAGAPIRLPFSWPRTAMANAAILRRSGIRMPGGGRDPIVRQHLARQLRLVVHGFDGGFHDGRIRMIEKLGGALAASGETAMTYATAFAYRGRGSGIAGCAWISRIAVASKPGNSAVRARS